MFKNNSLAIIKDLLSFILFVIPEGSSHADMIQDLNDIAVLGKENPDPLKTINFDITRLDNAAKTADEMAELLATSTAEDDDSESVKVRNKAYTHLKEAVDEVRGCGQYVFWRDKERVKGYSSAYHRRTRGKKSNPETPEERPDN